MDLAGSAPDNAISPEGLEPRLRVLAGAAPIVVLHGARAVGKTRIAQELVAAGIYPEYVSLLDEAERRRAEASPSAYVDSMRLGGVIDEAQLVEQVTLQLKQRVDDPSDDARFLLTGSSRLRRAEEPRRCQT